MQAFRPLPDLKDSAAQRQTMVDCQIRTFGVTDQRLIGRFLAVPRERFLPEDVRALAYSDIGFSLPSKAGAGEARYLLPPLILARLIQGGRVRAIDKVLDVGGGAGYSAAILAGLARDVVSLEADADLSGDQRARLAGAGLDVRTLDGDLAAGAPAHGPFDVILVNGAVEANLESLLEQLAEGGRLLAIRRSRDDLTGRAAKALCFEKRNGEIGTRGLFDASAPVLPPFRKVAQFAF